MTKFTAALFDIDDTLIDFHGSEMVSLKSTHELFFKEFEYKAFLSDYSRINRGLWNAAEAGEIPISSISYQRFKQVLELYGLPFNAEIATHYEDQLIANCNWNEGAEELLESLLSKKFKIGFITNGFAAMQRTKSKNFGLHRFSEALVISEEIGVAKPHLHIFSHTIELLGLNPAETLMIGDSLNSDGEGARKAGMPFCWYNPTQGPNTKAWTPHFNIHHFDLAKEILSL